MEDLIDESTQDLGGTTLRLQQRKSVKLPTKRATTTFIGDQSILQESGTTLSCPLPMNRLGELLDLRWIVSRKPQRLGIGNPRASGRARSRVKSSKELHRSIVQECKSPESWGSQNTR